MTICEIINEILKYIPNANVGNLWTYSKKDLQIILQELKKKANNELVYYATCPECGKKICIRIKKESNKRK